MSELSATDEAVDLLQELGLKEYEAKCFVALSRLPHGTARDISDISDVPRTRVYDATRVLESKGLAEVQDSTPQKFRAVDIEIAVDILTSEYESRMSRLEALLANVDVVEMDGTSDDGTEVWSLSGQSAISDRIQHLVDTADSELYVLLRRVGTFSNQLLPELKDATDRGVTVHIGALTEAQKESIQAEITDVDVSVAELGWLMEMGDNTGTILNCLLAADGEQILVSSRSASDDAEMYATVANGYDNGLVAMVWRLLAEELSDDSG